MFDPNTGRWFTVDPSGFAAGDTNLLRYCGNNPTNRVDPSGLQPTLALSLMAPATCSTQRNAGLSLSPVGAVGLGMLDFCPWWDPYDYPGKMDPCKHPGVLMGPAYMSKKHGVPPLLLPPKVTKPFGTIPIKNEYPTFTTWRPSPLITLESGNTTGNIFNNIFHQQICVVTSKYGKICFSFGVSGSDPIGLEVGGKWLDWESTTCCILKGRVYNPSPVPGAKIERGKWTTQAEADQFATRLTAMMGRTGGYSLGRHSCRDFSQQMFDEAPGSEHPISR